MSRLSIEVDAEQHRQIKTLATFSGMSMKEYILSKVLPVKDDQDTTDKLLSHPDNKERLIEAINTPQDSHLVFETMDDLKNALGI